MLQTGVCKLYLLPFSSDSEEVIKAAKSFAEQSNPDRDILVFHNELDQCRFNVQTRAKGAPIRVSDLCPKSFLYVIGGHIHFQQQFQVPFRNVWYVGSPFVHDWGEANQRKGYLLVDTTAKTIQPISSNMSRLYDPSLPGFKRPSSWKGHTVRVHVACDQSVPDIGQFINRTKLQAEKKYPEASIVVVPEFLDSSKDHLDVEGATDKALIESYVRKTVLPDLSNRVEEITAYILHKLSVVGQLIRSEPGLKLLRGTARNFLSFKKLELDYTHRGITLVTGRNEDMPGASNGAGKSNLLALPSVALFGKNIKGQQHDAWSRQGRKDGTPSWVKLEFEISGGRRCEVFRGRKPKGLKLSVEGKDVSTGIGMKGTQTLLETLTGLTWEMLRNVMYIDQHEVTRILGGSDRERKDILCKFLNLERFTKAQDEVKAEAVVLQERFQELFTEEQSLLAVILEANKHLESVEGSIRRTGLCKKKVESLTEKHKRLAAKLLRLQKKDTRLVADARRVNEALSVAEKTHGSLESRYADTQVKLSRLLRLTGDCPTCLRPVGKEIEGPKKELNRVLASIKKQMDAASEVVSQAEDTYQRVFTECRALTDRIGRLIEIRENTRSNLHFYETELAEAKASAKIESEIQATIESSTLKALIITKALRQAEREKIFLEYCISVLSRSGLPAHLAYQLCPMLNAAAQQYSKMICNGLLNVKFVLDGTDIDVQVTNIQGGAGLLDQSNGETRLLSIIIGFALRQVLAPCNVIVLDEPGTGLDSHNARVVGSALKKIPRSFGTIMLTTHSPSIISELEDCKQITVVKSNRVSRIEV